MWNFNYCHGVLNADKQPNGMVREWDQQSASYLIVEYVNGRRHGHGVVYDLQRKTIKKRDFLWGDTALEY